MNLSFELDNLLARGFSTDRAHAVILLRESSILLFRAFPDSFLLYGGANLLLFHDSLRTSRDLDLLSHGSPRPQTTELIQVLTEGLQELGKLLGLAPLTVETRFENPAAVKLEVLSHDGTSLFTVDLGGLGTVLQSGVTERALEAVSLDATATVRYVSADHLLLQKAEAFLFRSAIKVRDAYDIRLLQAAGTALSDHLTAHLSDALAMREAGEAEIRERIGQITVKLCRAQLGEVLPEAEYQALERAGFEPLRAAVQKLFQNWLTE